MSVYNWTQYNDTFNFIHIPRTGGTSLKRALKIRADEHKTLSMLINEKGVNTVNSQFNFTIVRDPICRFVSAYNWSRQKGIINMRIDRLIHDLHIDILDMEWSKQCLFVPQTRFLEFRGDNDFSIVDHIGRFERLQLEYDMLNKKFGVGESMRFKAKSDNYAHEYDLSRKTIKSLKTLYRKDFVNFYPERIKWSYK